MDGKSHPIVLNESKTLGPIVCDTLAVHSLPVNFNFGKTGFVFHMRGRGKRKNVFSLDADNRRCITLVTQSVGNVPCFVYSDYKHVGSIHPDSCSYSQEAAARILSPRVAKRETCTMTNSKLLDIKTKIHLVKTFCISRLFFNVASIPHWTSKSLTNFCKCYNSIFRSALLGRNDEGEVEKISNLAFFQA